MYLRSNTEVFLREFNHSAVRKIIQELNRINLEEVDYDYVKQKVGNLFRGIKCKGISLNKGQSLFRGIVYDEKPANVSYLGAPPEELVSGFQRCNSPGNPLFYCSGHQAPVLYEIHPKKGGKVYMSKWSVIKNDQFLITLSPNHLDDDMSPLLSSIYSFFDTKFSEPIHDTFSFRYKVTSAIAELLIRDNLFDRKAVGIAHTSVAYPGGADNIVLLPEYVASNLSLDYVEELEITDVSKQGFQAKFTDIATDFIGGIIHWKGRTKEHAIPSKSTANFVMENGGWVMKDNEGNIIDPN